MKATVLLRKDHDTFRSTLTQLGQPLRGNDKSALFDQLREEFRIHRQIEQQLLYAELLNTASTNAPDLVSEAKEYLRQLGELLEETHKPSTQKVDAKMAALRETFEEYIRFEEDKIFEEARQFLTEYRMEELGLEMEDRRRFL